MKVGGTLFPSETTNLPYRIVSEVFYYGIRTVCRALTFVPVVGQGLSFWLWGRVLQGNHVWKCYQIILWQWHVPSINLTEQWKSTLSCQTTERHHEIGWSQQPKKIIKIILTTAWKFVCVVTLDLWRIKTYTGQLNLEDESLSEVRPRRSEGFTFQWICDVVCFILTIGHYL